MQKLQLNIPCCSTTGLHLVVWLVITKHCNQLIHCLVTTQHFLTQYQLLSRRISFGTWILRILQKSRCMRMNKAQLRDPVIEHACCRSNIVYEDLGLPKEMTIWVDPGEVSCRYGEKSTPFCVTQLEGEKKDGEFSRRINNAVERASSDYHSGTSSDEEGSNTSMSSSISSSVSSTMSTNSSNISVPEPKCIPTVSNPNSVYQFSEFGPPPPVQNWGSYPKRKPYANEGYQQHSSSGPYPPHKSFKGYRPSHAFSGPRVDRYHWVSKNRS